MLFFSCPHCQRSLRVPERFWGQRGACNLCGRTIEIPAAPPPNPPDESPQKACSPEWYEARRAHLTYCIQNADEAVQRFPRAPEGEETWEVLIAQAQGNTNLKHGEILCRKAIAQGASSPWPYERLAALRAHAGDHQAAFEICRQYFTTADWWIPEYAGPALSLLESMAKLDQLLHDSSSGVGTKT
jgi:hypothetical protein